MLGKFSTDEGKTVGNRNLVLKTNAEISMNGASKKRGSLKENGNRNDLEIF